MTKGHWSHFYTVLVSFATLSIGYLIGTVYPPPTNPTTRIITQILFNSKPAPPPPPPKVGTPESDQIIQDLESQLDALKIVKELKSKPDEWTYNRPYQNVDPARAVHSLTLGSLNGVGKFAIRPLIFVNKDETRAIIIIHVGRSMCGYDGIIHGGLCATICDEGLGRIAIPNLPSKIGVTAALNIKYRKPTLPDQFLVLKSQLADRPQDTKQGNRKIWVNGTLENLEGEVMVEAEALFIEPKYAKVLKNSIVKEMF